MADIEKDRRERLRWHLLRVLDWNRPYTMPDARMWEIATANFPDTTVMEIRRELDYLADRELVALDKSQSSPWFADLTRHGVDIVEYTVDCQPGIARPPKYGML
jgi:hypothetical protein